MIPQGSRETIGSAPDRLLCARVPMHSPRCRETLLACSGSPPALAGAPVSVSWKTNAGKPAPLPKSNTECGRSGILLAAHSASPRSGSMSFQSVEAVRFTLRFHFSSSSRKIRIDSMARASRGGADVCSNRSPICLSGIILRTALIDACLMTIERMQLATWRKLVWNAARAGSSGWKSQPALHQESCRPCRGSSDGYETVFLGLRG